jgi:hypothetical protein
MNGGDTNMPIHTYTNWNSRESDRTEQIEPYRKYFFICEGANTETFYFRKLIDIRKELGIHPLIDIRLWEKTGADRNLSFAKNLVDFAEKQKKMAENDFDPERDKMVIVFDGDIFEEKVQGYEELICTIEKSDIAAVSNPGFEMFLLLHLDGSYEKYIKDHEEDFLKMDEKGRYSYAYNVLLEATGMNAKKNSDIGGLAENVLTAIGQERKINQNIHKLKGKVSSNVGLVIESIINEKPSPS